MSSYVRRLDIVVKCYDLFFFSPNYYLNLINFILIFCRDIVCNYLEISDFTAMVYCRQSHSHLYHRVFGASNKIKHHSLHNFSSYTDTYCFRIAVMIIDPSPKPSTATPDSIRQSVLQTQKHADTGAGGFDYSPILPVPESGEEFAPGLCRVIGRSHIICFQIHTLTAICRENVRLWL